MLREDDAWKARVAEGGRTALDILKGVDKPRYSGRSLSTDEKARDFLIGLDTQLPIHDWFQYIFHDK
jgi:hypothetical protein